MSNVFLEESFPYPPQLAGYRRKVRYNTTVAPYASGFESRNRNWLYPLHEYNFDREDVENVMEDILDFYHVVGQMECGFRFKDWFEYKSCRRMEEPSATDQPLVQIDSTHYQLIKYRELGTRSQIRRITKPVAIDDSTADILLADGGVSKTQGSHYSVDTTTGVVTISFTPSGALTWGGTFDVPVRFNDDLEQELTFRDDGGIYVAAVPFSLIELKK